MMKIKSKAQLAWMFIHNPDYANWVVSKTKFHKGLPIRIIKGKTKRSSWVRQVLK